jgi:hypothetical protein
MPLTPLWTLRPSLFSSDLFSPFAPSGADMITVTQALSVSALIAANESMIESKRFTENEAQAITNIIGMVRASFIEPQRLPTLIVADPEFDSQLDAVAAEMGAQQ